MIICNAKCRVYFGHIRSDTRVAGNKMGMAPKESGWVGTEYR